MIEPSDVSIVAMYVFSTSMHIGGCASNEVIRALDPSAFGHSVIEVRVLTLGAHETEKHPIGPRARQRENTVWTHGVLTPTRSLARAAQGFREHTRRQQAFADRPKELDELRGTFITNSIDERLRSLIGRGLNVDSELTTNVGE